MIVGELVLGDQDDIYCFLYCSVHFECYGDLQGKIAVLSKESGDKQDLYFLLYYIIGSTGYCPQRLATLLLSQLLYDYMNYGFILTLPVLVLFFCVVSEMWFMIEPICFGLEEQDQEFLIYSM